MKRFVLSWVGVVLLGAGVCAAQGQAGAKRPMTFADLMAMKRVSDPQISPSGKWVMFSVTDVSLEKNTKVNHLWVVPIDGSAPERQVTFGANGAGETFGRFSPDGKWVSYSAWDEVYVAPWDEAAGKVDFGVSRQLTYVTTGADGAVWSPDSKRLMFVAEVWPECSVKGGGGETTATTKATTEILTGGQNDASIGGGGHPGFVVGGTRDVSALKGAEPAGWAEEDACDKAKDEAAAKSPVKGQVWDGLLYRHWDHYTGAKRSHILVVDVSDGLHVGANVRDLTPASTVGDAETPTWMLGGPLGYAWAPDSKEIAYVTNLDPVPAASTNNDVFTLRLDEPGAKAVKLSTSPGSDDEPEYSPDGKWLAFRSQARAGFESDKFRLMLFDREKKTARELVPNFDDWVDEFTWAPDSNSIFFASGSRGEEPVYQFRIGQNDLTLVVTEPMSVHGEFSELSVAPSGKVLVVSRTLVSEPTRIVAFLLDVHSPVIIDPAIPKHPKPEVPGQPNIFPVPDVVYGKDLTHTNDELLTQLDLNQFEDFDFKGAEGTKVEGFLVKPPNFDPAKKYPVKFLMHGGPQTAWGDAWSYRWNWELMASSGYVVIGINRRGSTGYGQKFVDEVSGDWGGRAYEDLMKGLDYAEAHFSFIDKTRECALGASYGGFMADWVLTHTDRFKCIVTHDGMYDPVSAWGDTEEMWFNEWEFRRPEDFPKGWDGFSGGSGKATTEILTKGQNDERGVGHPAEPWRYQNLPADQDPFRKWSPMRFIENAKTPTLVIHSQKDYRLDVSQGMELFTALQRQGVPSKFLYFPDEGHWVLKPQNSEMWNAVVSDWCDRWTKSNAYAETK
jgi:dipeptidyl aminopeptidase/acylaminoacyl peptidase